jgi:hypothetical protein
MQDTTARIASPKNIDASVTGKQAGVDVNDLAPG